MTFADPQDHVKQAERNDRTVKERVRATFWRLPFESLPKILIRKLAQQVTQKINYVCMLPTSADTWLDTCADS